MLKMCKETDLTIVGKQEITEVLCKKKFTWEIVVLGWIISLCVEPGIEPATFRFQSKALVTPLPSLRSSSTVPKPGIELARNNKRGDIGVP